jgi:hypothetical protein
MSNKNIYMIVNDFYMKKERGAFQHSNNLDFFSNEEECLMKIEENIEEADVSSKIYLKKGISEGKIQLADTYAQRFSYNILQYQPKFEGHIFNLGIVIWSKETGEVKYKFIKDKQLQKLVKVMPGLKHISYVLENFKKQKTKNIHKTRHLILSTNNHCNELFFKHKLLTRYTKHEKNMDNISIKEVCNNIYNDKVGFLFERED